MKEYLVELVIRESTGSMVSFDIIVKAENKNKARTLAKNYAKDKGYKLITMAIERRKK